VSEFHHEPIRGLPGPLPPGERLLWQGSPRWQGLARHAFAVRVVAGYFLCLLVWRVVDDVQAGQSLAATAAALVMPIGLMLAALLMLYAVAYLAARCTVYTITDRRVAIRSGIALPLSLNIPFARIDGVALRAHADGTGDLSLVLSAGERVGYLLNWPNMRPWRLTRTEPMLRNIVDSAAVGAVLANAMRVAESRGAAEVTAFESTYATNSVVAA
jgi:hypothetical protein